jgi:hypothetical protein
MLKKRSRNVVAVVIAVMGLVIAGTGAANAWRYVSTTLRQLVVGI